MLLHNILYCLVEVGFQIESKFHFELALEKLEKEKKSFLLPVFGRRPAFAVTHFFPVPACSTSFP